jgi:4-hydroxy-3-methylbut-2-enyl diphosphate reductase IspH
MAFKSKQIRVEAAPTEVQQVAEPDVNVILENTLNPKEIEFILSKLKDQIIKMEQVEFAYHAVLKLQNQYTAQTTPSL